MAKQKKVKGKRKAKTLKGSCEHKVMKITGRSKATADRVCKALK